MPLGWRSKVSLDPSARVTVVVCGWSVLLTTQYKPCPGKWATSHSGLLELHAAYRSSLWEAQNRARYNNLALAAEYGRPEI